MENGRVVRVTLIVLVVLSLAACGFFLFRLVDAQKAFHETDVSMSQQLEQIRSERDALSKQVEDARKSFAASSLGLTAQRLDSDEALIQTILQDMCKWKTSDEYDAMRKRMTDEYGIAKDSWLMMEFLPEPSRDAHTGESVIDARGYNMSLGAVDIRCTGVEDGISSYFVQASVSSNFEDVQSASLCAFEFKIDAYGKLVGADGMSISE